MGADMATGSNASLHVLQFSGENYHIWVVKMRSYLKYFGLWEYVAEDKQVPALIANPTIAQIKQYEEEKMKRDKAVTCLHSALTDSVFTSIMHLETTKSIWDELKSRFEGSEKVKLVKLLTLKREFENLKMKDSETVMDYSSKLSDLENQMRLYGDVVEDYKVVEKMLINLLEKFEAKVAAIEESYDLKKMTISEMVSKLQAQEQRHALRNDGDMEKTFLAMNKGKHKDKGKMDAASLEFGPRVRFPTCTTCKRINHLAEDCWHKGKPQVQRIFCNKWGHREQYCRLKQNQQIQQPMQQQTQQPMQQANYTDDHVCDEHLFTMSQPCMAASTEIWYVDSGCISHMARDAGMFTTLDRNATTTVKLGNGDMVKAARKGKVLIQTISGPKIIDNVLYIPDLAQNLLSVAQLLKRGYSLIFERNLCIILYFKKSEIVRVRMHENSFHIDFNQVKLNASMSNNDMDVQATSRTYGLRDACQNGKAPMKPKIDGVFDGHSSNESVMDDEATQMDEKKLAMKEELMMIKRNQALSSTKAEYIAAAAAPKQAKWIKKVSTNLNCVEKKPTGLWSEEHLANITTKALTGTKFDVISSTESEDTRMRPINTSTSKIEKGLPPMSNKTQTKDQAYTFGGSEYGESFVEETQVASQGKIVGQGISLCIDLRSNESRDLGGIDMGGQKEVTAETITASDRGAMGRIKDRREKRKIGKGIQSRVKSQPMKTSRTTGSKKKLKEVIWNLDEEITKIFEKGAELGVVFYSNKA
ncbi:hypothetical protein EZV62_005261 [Acer yangbiense]|uniref:Retrovirus-related Pol polyprotein from transposon TNT 1-94-like beta-barrel domain-containing protein n=1 Tax=Acer yangbiense TaxID=1000413 RepID=A0A5C7IPC1_9ROSI|nr:hypothetical protein EZV62_005261 [Acer yangbiense]